jgi:hypothetical protein
MKKPLFGLLFVCATLTQGSLYGQGFLTEMADTTHQIGKGLFSIYERYDRVKMIGYLQPQFQVTSKKGAESFNGGNFNELSNNRFMLRRGRLRVDYTHLNKKNEPTAFFVFQFDGTERGFVTRDFFGKFYENKFKLFSVTTGLLPRPFGYEVNLPSVNRESPERGRMSQILMKTERDVGVMLSLDDRKKDSKIKYLKVDIGIFNGQGLNGPTDFDSHKDLVGRVSLKPYKIKAMGGATLTGGISGYLGGMTNQGMVEYKTVKAGEKYTMQRDSSSKNYLKLAPRNYLGADVQLVIPNLRGSTQLRAEYIVGKQTATALSTESPGTYPVTNGHKDPLYIRNFDGAYFYFLQHLGSEKHQFVAKYDWYDPNKKVAGRDLNANDGFSKADLRYNSVGVGYVYYANSSLKFTFYFDKVRNESTNLADFRNDVSDDIFTCRVQYTF